LARNQSTLPIPLELGSKALQILSMLLLYQPHRELKALKDLWVDNIIYTEHWRIFLGNQIQEWRSISLLSTLLLLVDTALVTHFHIQPSTWSSHLPGAKTGCIAGTMSLLLATSTMVVGVTSVLVNQPYAKSHASEATMYLENASHERLGLHPLAIALSLPRALFLWALATASIALLTFSLQNLDVWGLGLVGMFGIFLCSLIFWILWFFQVGKMGPSKCVYFAGFPSTVRVFFQYRNRSQDPESG